MDIQDFNKTWETEYIMSRVKKVAESVAAGRYEQAIDYLDMIRIKAEIAIGEIRELNRSQN